MPVGGLVVSVDTGVDDAVALVVAARAVPGLLRAVVCSYGNAPLDRVVANTRYVLAVAGAGVPVAVGADRPAGAERPWRTVRPGHAPDGLLGLGPSSVPAVVPDGGLAAALGAEPAHWVALGPLTDVARAAERGLVRTVHVAGQVDPVGANLAMDPGAWAGLAATGLPVTTFGHAVSRGRAVPEDLVERLVGADDPGVALAGRLLARRRVRVGHAWPGDAAVLTAALMALGVLDRADPTDAVVDVLLRHPG